MEALLQRHQSFYPDVPLHSTKEEVKAVIEYAEESIRALIDSGEMGLADYHFYPLHSPGRPGVK